MSGFTQNRTEDVLQRSVPVTGTLGYNCHNGQHASNRLGRKGARMTWSRGVTGSVALRGSGGRCMAGDRWRDYWKFVGGGRRLSAAAGSCPPQIGVLLRMYLFYEYIFQKKKNCCESWWLRKRREKGKLGYMLFES